MWRNKAKTEVETRETPTAFHLFKIHPLQSDRIHIHHSVANPFGANSYLTLHFHSPHPSVVIVWDSEIWCKSDSSARQTSEIWFRVSTRAQHKTKVRFRFAPLTVQLYFRSRYFFHPPPSTSSMKRAEKRRGKKIPIKLTHPKILSLYFRQKWTLCRQLHRHRLMLAWALCTVWCVTE